MIFGNIRINSRGKLGGNDNNAFDAEFVAIGSQCFGKIYYENWNIKISWLLLYYCKLMELSEKCIVDRSVLNSENVHYIPQTIVWVECKNNFILI